MAGENLCFGNMEGAFEQWAEQGRWQQEYKCIFVRQNAQINL